MFGHHSLEIQQGQKHSEDLFNQKVMDEGVTSSDKQ